MNGMQQAYSCWKKLALKNDCRESCHEDLKVILLAKQIFHYGKAKILS